MPTPTSPYRAVLFDWDGTIANSLSTWMRCYQWALHGWGLNPKPEKIAAQFGDWRGVLTLGVREDSFEAFWQLMHHYLDQELPKVSLFEQVMPTLQSLRDHGVRTGLVTTGTWAHFGPVLQRKQLEPLFDVVISGDDVTHHKPHPQPLQLALSKLTVPPDEALMVGDNEKDLAAAAAAGVDSLLFYPPEHAEVYDEQQLRAHHPTLVCTSWAEIAALLVPQSTPSAP